MDSGAKENAIMNTTIILVLALVLATLSGTSGDALAQMGGLALPEDGGPINGTAQAGSAAVARDAQTAWLNPAGMTRLASREILVAHVRERLRFLGGR